jgi:hypothetical protein
VPDLDGHAGGNEAVEQTVRSADREAEYVHRRGSRDERHRGQDLDHGDHP